MRGSAGQLRLEDPPHTLVIGAVWHRPYVDSQILQAADESVLTL
jgi:hypothetical protein